MRNAWACVVLGLALVWTSRDAGAQAPKDDPVFQEVAALYQQGVDAKGRKEYARSTSFFEAALALKPLPPSLASLPSTLHYAVACNHALLGNTPHALASLEAAVSAGFAEWDDAEADNDLKSLRALPMWSALVKRMKDNARRARVYVVTALESAEHGSARLHAFEDVNSAHQARLRETYALADLVKDAPTEWDAQLRVLTWVHNRWEHAGLDEPQKADAPSILAEVAAGKRFRCVEYSVVSAQLLQALGHPARVVSLKRDGASYGLGKGHVVTEVWSNLWRKWVVMDGQNNGTWQVKGTPLSAVEVREQRKRDPGALAFVLGPSLWRHKTQQPEGMKAEWLPYFEHIAMPLVNSYPSSKDTPRISPLGNDESVELLFQGMPPLLGSVTRNPERAYPQMNTVHVGVDRKDGPVGTVEVTVEPTGSPWFSHLVTTVNGDAALVEPLKPYRWTLRPGRNVFLVRAVNAMGHAGEQARVEVEYFPPSAAP